MLESELEPEFVGLLEKIQQPDPAFEPGKQAEKARDLPVKLITGAYLSRLGLPMVPFDCHLKFAPTLGALFCRYEGEDLAEKLLLALEHWRTLGLDLKVMEGMVQVFYAELWRKRGSPLPAEAGPVNEKRRTRNEERREP
jgi:hypothetical protein